MHSRRSLLAVATAAGILLLALTCRYYPFRYEIIGDEVFSANMASLPPGELLDVIGTYDVHPPGYYLVLGLVGEAQGRTWKIRLPSLFFGLLLIGVVFGIGRAMGSAWLGLWFAALVAAGAIFCKQSALARSYAMHVLLASAAWLVLLVAMRRGGTGWWTLLGVLVAANCWTFYYTAHVIVALSAFFLLARPTKRQVGAYGFALAGAGLVSLPLLRIVGTQMEIAASQSKAVHAAGWNWEWISDELLGEHLYELGPWGGKGYVLVALAVGLAVWFVVLRPRLGHIPAGEPERRASRWLVPTLGAACFFLVAVVLSAELNPLAHAHHAAFLAVIFCVLAGLLVARLPKHCAAALLLALVAGSAIHTIVRTRRVEPAGFEAATASVLENARAGDVVLCLHAAAKPVYDWFARGRGPEAWTTHVNEPKPWRWHTPSWAFEGSAPHTSPLAGAARVWVVWSAPHLEVPDAEQRLRAHLAAQGFRSDFREAYDEVRLERYGR